VFPASVKKLKIIRAQVLFPQKETNAEAADPRAFMLRLPIAAKESYALPFFTLFLFNLS